jgi:carbon storage regulator
MLILKRKSNESIMIGDNIEIEVLSMDGDQVKLGIRAPKEVEVHRKEVFQAIQVSNKEAAKGQSLDFLKSLKR